MIMIKYINKMLQMIIIINIVITIQIRNSNLKFKFEFSNLNFQIVIFTFTKKGLGRKVNGRPIKSDNNLEKYNVCSIL